MIFSVNQARQEVLGELARATPDELRAWSAVITAQAVSFFQSQKEEISGLRIALYRSLSREIDLEPLEEFLLSEEVLLHYPRLVSKEEGRMEMVFVPEPFDEQWSKGAMGIQEPEVARPSVDPATLDWIVVPGLVFGENGQRAGRGLGFYDRFLARASQARRLALAYDFQVREELEQKQWDQPVDFIITEKRTCQRAPSRLE